MVITAITLENFKGIKGPCRIKLKPLTMLFGANSAGKSTVVQALHYAREIFLRQNTDPDKTLLGGSMDLGGFSNLVYKHDQSLPIKITFDLDLSAESLPDYYDAEANLWEWEQHELKLAVNKIKTISLSITIQVIDKDRRSSFAGRPAITEYKVLANDEPLAKLELIPGDEQVKLILNPFNAIYWDGCCEIRDLCKNSFFAVAIEDDGRHDFSGTLLKYLFIEPSQNHNVVDIDGYSSTDGKILRSLISPMPKWNQLLPLSDSFEFVDFSSDGDLQKVPPLIISSCLTSLITGPGEMIRNDLERMCYLGPIREVPQRNNSEIKSPDPSRWANGLAAWDALYCQGEDLIKKTNQWFASDERLDSGYRLEMEEFRRINENGRLMAAIRAGRSLDAYQDELDIVLAQKPEKRLYLVEEAKNIKVMPHDVGVGISQVLPVIVASLITHNTILAIEQPELHIHPKLQVGLGDLFIHESTTKENCFIIETHSEHLMLRIMRRIRQTSSNELPPNAPELDPEQVAIYHIRSTEEGTVFKEILIDKDGDFLTRWPGGFFAERSEELFS
ncbi:AAA ATPase domain protein [anaerobic digester metagenome]